MCEPDSREPEKGGIEENLSPFTKLSAEYPENFQAPGIVSYKRKNTGFKAPQISEKYKNLSFVGGSVNPGGGMPMVFLSGQQVKDKIVKEQQGK